MSRLPGLSPGQTNKLNFTYITQYNYTIHCTIINPPPALDKLRPISGLFNAAKIADRIIANIITKDISPQRDKCQYGNQKGLSVNHYLINMINQILTSLDKNSNKEKMADVVNKMDWSMAFER